MKQVALALLLWSALAAQDDSRFQRGDDLRWAGPAFDDSAWPRLDRLRPATAEDMLTNRYWERHRLEISPGGPWAFIVRNCACEFYLNGVRIGATADLRDARPRPGRPTQIVWLPAETRPGPVVLAVRGYQMTGLAAIAGRQHLNTLRLVPLAQLPGALAERKSLAAETGVVLLMILLAALAGLAGDRFDALAILIGLYLLVAAVISVLYSTDLGGDMFDRWVAGSFIGAAQAPLIVFVIARLCGVPLRPAWVIPYVAVHALIRGAYAREMLLPAPGPWTQSFLYLFPAGYWMACLLCLAIAIRRWRAPGTPRLLVMFGVSSLVVGVWARYATSVGIPAFDNVLPWDRTGNLAFGALAVLFLLRRSRDRRDEEQRLKSELQAARGVQALLLGQRLPPGVDAVYFPASEVGGDFYQACETPGGTLVLAGDVSGKGMQAAMTVSALVGAFRNRHAQSPSGILAELNAVTAGSPGFVTCCCVLVNGACIRIANAGHPPPYLDGIEFSGEGGLPLGVDPDVQYHERDLPAPALLTLVSDGVVEAANANGELFGFDRTREISGKPAQEIANAAKAWGQNDDITVVTIRREEK